MASRTPPVVQALPTVRRVTDPDTPEKPAERPPGSAGERRLQLAFGTQARAERFYADQVRDRLSSAMVAFVGRIEAVFIASADARGECDASLRAGPPGFVQVLGDRTLAYPEYRGNGVHASLGNISENPQVGLLMVDFTEDLVGLHVNGAARIVADGAFRAEHPGVPRDAARGRRAERWVVVHVEEAYIHCRKHIPRMQRVTEPREWGTDDPGRKGGDYFGVRGTPRTASPVSPQRRRRFPSSTHLGAGLSSRTLRPRPRPAR